MTVDLDAIREAALDRRPVQGLTHTFYRYPARFSPQFASAVIRAFTRPGELVLDPFMGGGTAIVEAYAHGRRAYGIDLNQLAVFITRAKLTALSPVQLARTAEWVQMTAETMTYRRPVDRTSQNDSRMRNLYLPEARPIRKALSIALSTLSVLPTADERRFARCILLRLGQWALDGRRSIPTLAQVRQRLPIIAQDMFDSMRALKARAAKIGGRRQDVRVTCADARTLPSLPGFRHGQQADLVLTSPPYPGVHVLYHRWQIRGRRETPAPYWVAACRDGQGASYYNLGSRHEAELAGYFAGLQEVFTAIRGVMKPGAVLVQLVALGKASPDLEQYLATLERAGLTEITHWHGGPVRIQREVPGRKWHAVMKGPLRSAREIVLFHQRST